MKEHRIRGEAAAKVFALLTRGIVDLRAIVIETSLDPDIVHEMKQEYERTFEAAKAETERIRLERELKQLQRQEERERYRQQNHAPMTSTFGISSRKTA